MPECGREASDVAAALLQFVTDNPRIMLWACAMPGSWSRLTPDDASPGVRWLCCPDAGRPRGCLLVE